MHNNIISAGLQILAMLLDHIILSFAMVILMMPFISLQFKDAFSENNTAVNDPFDSIFYVMVFCLSLYLNKDMIHGKSIAKRILKQEVVNAKTGEVASPLRCLVRNIPILIWPLEVLIVLFSPSRRLGDLIAGTRVVEITKKREPKPKINYRDIIVSIILGFIFLLSTLWLFYEGIGYDFPKTPEYIESSYNAELSSTLKDHLIDVRSDYLKDVRIYAYNKMQNDSVKYISASFLLKENYIVNNHEFEYVSKEIFKSMYDIIPKDEFILSGKFIYNGKFNKQSTWRTYDWRE